MLKRISVITAALVIAAASPVYGAGRWVYTPRGEWWQREDGSYPAGCWQWISSGDVPAECYCFDAEGYLLKDTVTPDGYQVNEYGAWVENGVVQKRQQADDSMEVIATFAVTEEDYRLMQSIGKDRNTGIAVQPAPGDGAEAYCDIDPDELAERIAELVNEERVKAGRSELEINEELMENAGVRAEEASVRYYHSRPDGSSYNTVLTVPRYTSSENLAKAPAAGDTEAMAWMMVEEWMESGGHRKNILNEKWTETGVGVYEENGYIYISQLFIKN